MNHKISQFSNKMLVSSRQKEAKKQQALKIAEAKAAAEKLKKEARLIFCLAPKKWEPISQSCFF